MDKLWLDNTERLKKSVPEQIYEQKVPILMVVAIGLNTTATTDVPFNWLFAIFGNGLFALLISLAYRKTASVLEKTKQTSQRMSHHVKRLDKQIQNRANQAHLKSNITKPTAETEQLEIKAVNSAAHKALKKVDVVAKNLNKANEDLKSLRHIVACYNLYFLAKLNKACEIEPGMVARTMLGLSSKNYDLYRRLKSESTIVLVHQMGKVGSTSACRSLRAQTPYLTLHTHSLSRRSSYIMIKNLIETNRNRVKPHIVDSLYALQALNRQQSKTWKVVTLIREPIARNISGFFSGFFEKTELAQSFERTLGSNDVLNEEVDQAISGFLNGYCHDKVLTWLDAEIGEVFGVDVYASPFDVEKGYQIYKQDNVEVLLIRLEDLNSCHAEAFREFLGIENFELENANLSESKGYSHIYKAFKGRIKYKLPESYVDKMYTSKYATHFYSSEEITKFISQWTADE